MAVLGAYARDLGSISVPYPSSGDSLFTLAGVSNLPTFTVTGDSIAVVTYQITVDTSLNMGFNGLDNGGGGFPSPNNVTSVQTFVAPVSAGTHTYDVTVLYNSFGKPNPGTISDFKLSILMLDAS